MEHTVGGPRDGEDDGIAELCRVLGNGTGGLCPPACLAERASALVTNESRLRQIIETLRAAGLSLAKCLESGEVLEELLDYLAWIVPYDRATVFVSGTDGTLEERAARDFSSRGEKSARADFRPLMRLALRTGLPQGDGGTAYCAPLFAEGSPAGIVLVEKHGAPYGEEHYRIVETLAGYASAALRNAWLFERLQKSEGYYRALIENSSDITLVTDEAARIGYVSPSVRHILGYSQASVTGHLISEYVDASDMPAAGAYLEKVVSLKGGSASSDIAMLHSDGSTRILSVTARDMRDDPAVKGMVFNSRDVTENRARAREREAIADIASKLRKEDTREGILAALLERSNALLHADFVAVLATAVQEGNAEFFSRIGAWPAAREAGPEPESLRTGSGVREMCLEAMRLSAPCGTELGNPYGGCILYATLIADGSAIGVVMAARRSPFEKGEMHVLLALADMTASAANRAALRRHGELRVRRLDTLHLLDVIISGNRDLRYVFESILEQACLELSADAAAIAIVGKDSGSLEYAAARGFSSGDRELPPYPPGSGFAQFALDDRKMVFTHDLDGNRLGAGTPVIMTAERFSCYYGVPLIVKGRVLGVLEVFRRRPGAPGAEWESFLNTLSGQTAIAVANERLLSDLNAANDELLSSYDATIEGWSRALELRDHETEGHTARVTDMVMRLARRMDLPERSLLHLKRGALLHDIGKMGIPDAILLKSAELDEAEWTAMKRHPEYAKRLLEHIPYLESALDIPFCHHEKWDGSGYPRGLSGEAIPLSARMFAVVDIWDALTHDRPYHTAWNPDAALDHIVTLAGSHLDPAVVKAFVSLYAAGGA